MLKRLIRRRCLVNRKCRSFSSFWQSADDDSDVQSALEDQKAKFKVQIQELAVQIRYLKAKFTREATFRNGLSLQKRYLLLLVGGMSLK